MKHQRVAEALRDGIIEEMERVASADIPVPFTPVLENLYRPDRRWIAQTVRQIVSG